MTREEIEIEVADIERRVAARSVQESGFNTGAEPHERQDVLCAEFIRDVSKMTMTQPELALKARLVVRILDLEFDRWYE